MPFDSTGKGYRDTLIWLSVLARYEAAASGCEVFFVSDDGNFGKDGQLDPDLAAELPGTGAIFQRVRSFEDLLKHPSLSESTLTLEAELANGPSVSSVAESAVENGIEDLVGRPVDTDAERRALSIPSEVQDVEIQDAMPDGDFLWSAYDELDGTTVLGQGSMSAIVELRGYVAKQDAAILANADLKVESWADDMATVLFEREGKAAYDVRVEAGSESVEDLNFLGWEAN
jgi:hypothetical protein